MTPEKMKEIMDNPNYMPLGLSETEQYLDIPMSELGFKDKEKTQRILAESTMNHIPCESNTPFEGFFGEESGCIIDHKHREEIKDIIIDMKTFRKKEHQDV